MDFDANGLSKQVNAIQKEIAAKKKVCVVATRYRVHFTYIWYMGRRRKMQMSSSRKRKT